MKQQWQSSRVVEDLFGVVELLACHKGCKLLKKFEICIETIFHQPGQRQELRSACLVWLAG